MGRADAAGVVVLARGDVELAAWPLERRGRPVLALVDELARLQLGARRLGCTIRLCRAVCELRELLELVGLAPVLGLDGSPGSAVEPGGEAEDLEQAGVEEVVVADDPVA